MSLFPYFPSRAARLRIIHLSSTQEISHRRWFPCLISQFSTFVSSVMGFRQDSNHILNTDLGKHYTWRLKNVVNYPALNHIMTGLLEARTIPQAPKPGDFSTNVRSWSTWCWSVSGGHKFTVPSSFWVLVAALHNFYLEWLSSVHGINHISSCFMLAPMGFRHPTGGGRKDPRKPWFKKTFVSISLDLTHSRDILRLREDSRSPRYL